MIPWSFGSASSPLLDSEEI